MGACMQILYSAGCFAGWPSRIPTAGSTMILGPERRGTVRAPVTMAGGPHCAAHGLERPEGAGEWRRNRPFNLGPRPWAGGAECARRKEAERKAAGWPPRGPRACGARARMCSGGGDTSAGRGCFTRCSPLPPLQERGGAQWLHTANRVLKGAQRFPTAHNGQRSSVHREARGGPLRGGGGGEGGRSPGGRRRRRGLVLPRGRHGALGS